MGVYGSIVRNRRTARRAERGLSAVSLARLQGCGADRAAWIEAVAVAELCDRRSRRMLGQLEAEARIRESHSARADVLAGRES